MPAKKQLFGDDDDHEAENLAFGGAAESPDSFKVNRAYADKFDLVKRKQELQKLSTKYAGVEETDSEDTEEDDDAVLLNDAAENEFADLLLRLRSNDPSLRDKNTSFFAKKAAASAENGSDSDGEGEAGKKKFTLKDEYQRALKHQAAEEENADARGVRRKGLTTEQKSAREAFLNAAAAGGNDTAEFSVKAAPKASAKAGTEKRKEVVSAAFKDAKDDNDAFLANFFANEAWRKADDGNEPEYTWEQEAADDQDEDFYDDVEQWERDFQERKYRHEEGEEAAHIQAFPRHQEGLLRKDDTRRKDARERKEERKKEEESKATEELKRLKNLKRAEIEAFQRKIAEVAGLGRRNKKGAKPAAGADDDFDADDEDQKRIAALLSRAALEEEYDPDKFDAQMAALFDDNYYNNLDDEEMAKMAEVDELADSDDDDDDDDDGDNEEVGQPVAAKQKSKKQRKADVDLPAELGDVDSFLYPTKALDRAVAEPVQKKKGKAAVDTDGADADPEELQKQLDQKMDEYWKLHYSGTAGGMRTRFKYREVNPEHFGLDDEDIFMMDDRSLNMIAPLSSYATYLTKAQNTKDRFKAMHRRKNLRMLPADRKSRRYQRETVVFDVDKIDEQTGAEIAKKVHRAIAPNDHEDVDRELQQAAAEVSAKSEAIAGAHATKKSAMKAKWQEKRGKHAGESTPAEAGASASPEQRVVGQKAQRPPQGDRQERPPRPQQHRSEPKPQQHQQRRDAKPQTRPNPGA
jgi:protein KRI1